MGFLSGCFVVRPKSQAALTSPFELNTKGAFDSLFAQKFPREKNTKSNQNGNDVESGFHTIEILGGEMGLGNDFLFELRKRLPPLRRKAYAETLPVRLRDQIPKGLLTPDQAFSLSESALRQNLMVGEILQRIPLPPAENQVFRALDIGSRHFVYAPVLTRWIQTQAKAFEIELSGLELDPYVIYFDLYRRLDLGRYYAAVASGPQVSVTYRAGDWLSYPCTGRFDMITCFFPYLFEDLHRGDRLPLRSFDPELCYAKIIEATKFVVFFHQGAEEARRSVELLSAHSGVRIQSQFAVQETAYGRRKHPLYVISARV